VNVTRQIPVSGCDKIVSVGLPDDHGRARGRLWCRSGLADGAGEAGDEQGGERPGQQLQPPAGEGERLAGGAGGGVAVVPGSSLDQRQAEVQADADPLHRRAPGGRRWVRAGVGDAAVGAQGEREQHRDRDHREQGQQRPPGLVAVAQGQLGQPCPGPFGAAGQRPAVELVLPLRDQDPADLTVVARGTVRGSELLIRLRRVPRGGFAQQAQPLARGDANREPSVGQPVQGKPSLRVSGMLQPRRRKFQRTADPRLPQVDGRVATSADRLESAGKEDVLVGL
jgi:hypothetical protein